MIFWKVFPGEGPYSCRVTLFQPPGMECLICALTEDMKGMNCNHYKMAVEKALFAIPDVAAAHVQLAKKLAPVTGESLDVSRDKFSANRISASAERSYRGHKPQMRKDKPRQTCQGSFL